MTKTQHLSPREPALPLGCENLPITPATTHTAARRCGWTPPSPSPGWVRVGVAYGGSGWPAALQTLGLAASVMSGAWPWHPEEPRHLCAVTLVSACLSLH